jgi:uncharacterized small protein (DUF1192 family)
MSAQPSTPTTHIAAIITALHGRPVQVIYPPSDSELFERAFVAYAQVRWPEEHEDTDAIMNAARQAVRELHGRLRYMHEEFARLKAELSAERRLKQQALDAWDEQAEELAQLKKSHR